MLKLKFFGQLRTYYRNLCIAGEQPKDFPLSHSAAAHNYTGSGFQIKAYRIK
jgi:hypothetical protein